MKILCIGDVCGSIGCNTVRRLLPEFKKKAEIDFTVINGENSADGNGVSLESVESLFASGADIITGGNHSMRKKSSYNMYDENPRILRPDNLPEVKFGSGYAFVDCGYTSIAVINLSGTIYLENLGSSSPFSAADNLIARANNDGARIILVDFHAEATSEKRALGFYLDGRVTAFFGTHTHVQTADEQILPGGTGYITDIGMTGPCDSVLGVKKEIIIERLKDSKTEKFELANGECSLSGVVFTVDARNGMVTKAERILLK